MLDQIQPKNFPAQAIRFLPTSDAWSEFRMCVPRLIQSFGWKDVCEIGGGANPLISADFIKEHELNYTVLDISQEELDKAPGGIIKLCGDITGNHPFEESQFDFAFSMMLAEHVKDGRQFHQNVFKILKPGGYALHFFPTLYAFPFLVNHLIPESLSTNLLRFISPGRFDTGKTNKFPAIYSWTFGPTRCQLRRLQSIGYEVVSYEARVGHDGYYERLKLLQRVHRHISKIIIKLRLAPFTSYAVVLLRKPS